MARIAVTHGRSIGRAAPSSSGYSVCRFSQLSKEGRFCSGSQKAGCVSHVAGEEARRLTTVTRLGIGDSEVPAGRVEEGRHDVDLGRSHPLGECACAVQGCCTPVLVCRCPSGTAIFATRPRGRRVTLINSPIQVCHLWFARGGWLGHGRIGGPVVIPLYPTLPSSPPEADHSALVHLDTRCRACCRRATQEERRKGEEAGRASCQCQARLPTTCKLSSTRRLHRAPCCF